VLTWHREPAVNKKEAGCVHIALITLGKVIVPTTDPDGRAV